MLLDPITGRRDICTVGDLQAIGASLSFWCFRYGRLVGHPQT